MLDFNTSFKRSLSKLSENHKNVDIGSTVLKLWLLKDVQLHSPPFNQCFTTPPPPHTHPTHTQAEEERDYRDWLKENEGNKDLHGLRTFWGNPLLDTGEQFLRDYIIKGGHRDETQLSVPTYEEVVGVASDNEDEEALQEQEEFERKFNFRYEEPESDLVSYSAQLGLL